MLWTENKERKCREMRHEGSHDSKSQNLLIYRCARLVDSLRRSRFWVNAYLCLYAERRFKKLSFFLLLQTNANTHDVNEQAKSTNKKLLIKNTKGSSNLAKQKKNSKMHYSLRFPFNIDLHMQLLPISKCFHRYHDHHHRQQQQQFPNTIYAHKVSE